jgi:hypothetical protein
MLAICSLAFGKEYVWRLDRLKESLQLTNKDAELFFYREKYPEGAKPFNESLYGFKPYLIQEALRKGHTKIAYIDATCVVQGKLDYYDTQTNEYKGVLAVQDDNKLDRFVSNRALSAMNFTRQHAETMHMVGGSFYYFDFAFPTAQSVFNTWQKMEASGLFGSQRDEAAGLLQGHRHDEACMALALYTHRTKPYTGDTRYNYASGGDIIKKKHFK